MSENNARGVTPAERILALATGIVTLPRLSERAGEPVRVCADAQAIDFQVGDLEALS